MRVKIWSANIQGVNVTAVLEDMGYQNMTEFNQTIQNMIEAAQENIDDVSEVIQDLKEVSRILREMDRALSMEIWRHRMRRIFGYGNNGNGNGGNP